MYAYTSHNTHIWHNCKSTPLKSQTLCSSPSDSRGVTSSLFWKIHSFSQESPQPTKFPAGNRSHLDNVKQIKRLYPVGVWE